MTKSKEDKILENFLIRNHRRLQGEMATLLIRHKIAPNRVFDAVETLIGMDVSSFIKNIVEEGDERAALSDIIDGIEQAAQHGLKIKLADMEPLYKN